MERQPTKSAAGGAAEHQGNDQQSTADAPSTGAAGHAALTRMAGDGSEASAVASGFYSAFAAGNNGAMAGYYAPGVEFHDPLFGNISGAPKLMEMWSTISSAARNVQILPQVQSATPAGDGAWQVKVHWDAHYDLGKPNASHHVDNHSDTTLLIKDGKIVSQRDEWSLSEWTRQALPGIGGTAFGDFLASHAASAALEIIYAFKKIKSAL